MTWQLSSQSRSTALSSASSPSSPIDIEWERVTSLPHNSHYKKGASSRPLREREGGREGGKEGGGRKKRGREGGRERERARASRALSPLVSPRSSRPTPPLSSSLSSLLMYSRVQISSPSPLSLPHVSLFSSSTASLPHNLPARSFPSLSYIFPSLLTVSPSPPAPPPPLSRSSGRKTLLLLLPPQGR